VATAVAAGSPSQAIFALVSAEAGRLLGADAAAIGRFLDDTRVHVTGVWATTGETYTQPGQTYELEPTDELARVYATGRPVRLLDADGRRASKTRALGYHSFVAAPVYEGTTVWGVLGVAAHRPDAFPPGAEDRLREYTEMIATAVRNAEDRSRLDHQAGVDPLTALPNHRAFHERLAEEVSRARRHERPLTIAVVDVDRFRELTESVGPDAADHALVEIGELLRSVVREEDVVARLGADEFGIAFLETERATALLAAERARRLVAGTPLRHGVRLTVSVGLCDLDAAPTADELLRRADAALFWSKEHGRDRCWVYDASVVRDLAGHVRRRDLGQEQRLAGLCALARAIDAKDPATQEHSERVASLTRGWPRRAAGTANGSSACARPRSCTTSASSGSPTRSS
jgi:diguanylate cyclase (GGDEF)-like protein